MKNIILRKINFKCWCFIFRNIKSFDQFHHHAYTGWYSDATCSALEYTNSHSYQPNTGLFLVRFLDNFYLCNGDCVIGLHDHEILSLSISWGFYIKKSYQQFTTLKL